MRPTRVTHRLISAAAPEATRFLSASRFVDQALAAASCGWASPLLLSHAVPHWCGVVAGISDACLATELGGPTAQLCRTKQVHGNHWIDAKRYIHALPEADAVVSADRSLVAAVSTADCCPVLVACLTSGCVAAIHAGWRGLAADVIGATIHGMTSDFGAHPTHMVAAVGPCASASRYEVGKDVVDAFADRGLSSAIRVPEGTRSGHAFADCAKAAFLLLQRAGVPVASIESSAPCTISDVRFPSYRRDPSNPARMTSAIACRS